ncbi:aldolase/citrate lyase family protein, partial [Escherichia coli]
EMIDMTMKVGFIGLGIMGKPMSKNLLKAGYSLVVADRNPEAIADVIAAGAETASTAKAIAEQCDVIITMLPNSPHVKEVALGEKALGHLGNASHPDVQKAIQHIFNRASAHGKPSGILAPVEADARRYLEWGATFVAVGSDLGVFRSATQKLADTFKK